MSTMASHHHHADGHLHADHRSAEGHTHGVLAESYGHVQGGPPVLDIGGDIGALLAAMPASAAGTELHLRSDQHPETDIHTGVWRRGSGDDAMTTAVFAELLAGTYWVLDEAGRDHLMVQIRGGELGRVDLRPLAASVLHGETRV